MPRTIITLEGPVFRRQYLLYILELINNDRRFYYVGQTGDRKHTTARPPFRRLMGHLEDTGKSTQNQLYRYIAADILKIAEARRQEAFSSAIKQLVEDFLVGSTVRMHVYSLEPFRSAVSHDEHLIVLKRVEEFERHVLKRFGAAQLPLLNKSIHPPADKHLRTLVCSMRYRVISVLAQKVENDGKAFHFS